MVHPTVIPTWSRLWPPALLEAGDAVPPNVRLGPVADRSRRSPADRHAGRSDLSHSGVAPSRGPRTRGRSRASGQRVEGMKASEVLMLWPGYHRVVQPLLRTRCGSSRCYKLRPSPGPPPASPTGGVAGGRPGATSNEHHARASARVATVRGRPARCAGGNGAHTATAAKSTLSGGQTVPAQQSDNVAADRAGTMTIWRLDCATLGRDPNLARRGTNR
jgi:hypothetical protein